MNKIFFKVAAFYTFSDLLNLEELQEIFICFLKKEDIKGTVLLANEGVNGTLAGTEASIDRFKNFLQSNNLRYRLEDDKYFQTPLPSLKRMLSHSEYRQCKT